MPISIDPVENGESGLSVRQKINLLIAGARDGSIGAVTPEDLENVLDRTPPAVPSGLTVTSVTEPSNLMTIAWDFNSETDFAYYDIHVREAGGNWVGYQTSAEVLQLSVRPNITYEVKIRAVDQMGNMSAFGDVVSHTTARDTIPPAAPIGLTIRGGLESIWLSWIANTESDLSHYEIYESASDVTPLPSAERSHSTVANNFVRAGLNMETTLNFWVRAVDTSGNKSPWSARVEETTGKIRGEIKVALVGVTFKPGQGGGNKLEWTAGSIVYGVAGDVPSEQALPAGETTWTAGTIYVCYVPGRAQIDLYTSLTLMYADDAVILGIYKGGHDFQLVEGKAFMDGGLILAQTIGANQLVANAAVITGSAQIANAIIENAHILEMSAAKLMAGTALANTLTVSGRTLDSIATTDAYQDIMIDDWIRVSGTGTQSYSSAPLSVVTGSRSLVQNADGLAWLEAPNFIPYDPAKLYKITFRVRREGSASTDLSMLLGFVGYAGDKTTRINTAGANSLGNAHYCVRGSTAQSSVPTTFTEYVGYVRGYATTGFGASADLASPRPARDGVKFFRPLAVFNYNNTGTSAVMVLDSVKVEVVDEDAGAVVNAGSVLIEPGKVKIAGPATLESWKAGPDSTEMNGGAIKAGTISVDKGVFGLRGITVEGLQFEANLPVTNNVAWTAGTIKYIGDDGNIASFNVSAGSAVRTSGTLYVYYVKGTNALAATTAPATAFQDDRIVMAAYRGGIDLVTDYGRTVIDGAHLKTGTVIADGARIGSIDTEALAAGAVKAVNMDVDQLSAISADLGHFTAGVGEAPDGSFRITFNTGTLEWWDNS